MNDDYEYYITTNSVIMSLTKQIEGLIKQRESLLKYSIYCPICNKYYDKNNECISAGMEKKKKIRYRGDLEKGYDEFETFVPFYICPLNHKIEE